MSKQFWGVIIAIIVVSVGVFTLTGNNDDNSDSGSTAAASNHIQGNPDAAVKLVQYGDFQCPACIGYYPTIKQVVEEYGDTISFQYVNFPLTSLHLNAFAAARAAEAAGKQDKFWEMHDLLYQTSDPTSQSGWAGSKAPTTFFNQYATQIGLDLEKFKTDYSSSAINSIVNADLTKGNKNDVQGTPAFFVNGKTVSINNSAEDFKKVLDAELAKQTTGQGSGAQSSGTTQQTTGETEAQQ